MPRIALALTLLLAAAPGLARDRSIPPATPNGKPLDCISIAGLHSRVRSDQVIDFTSGRKVYRNTLPYACPSLGFEESFSYATSLSQLCSTDIITVLRTTGGGRGPSCGLGQFQPVDIARAAR